MKKILSIVLLACLYACDKNGDMHDLVLHDELCSEVYVNVSPVADYGWDANDYLTAQSLWNENWGTLFAEGSSVYRVDYFDQPYTSINGYTRFEGNSCSFFLPFNSYSLQARSGNTEYLTFENDGNASGAVATATPNRNAATSVAADSLGLTVRNSVDDLFFGDVLSTISSAECTMVEDGNGQMWIKTVGVPVYPATKLYALRLVLTDNYYGMVCQMATLTGMNASKNLYSGTVTEACAVQSDLHSVSSEADGEATIDTYIAKFNTFGRYQSGDSRGKCYLELYVGLKSGKYSHYVRDISSLIDKKSDGGLITVTVSANEIPQDGAANDPFVVTPEDWENHEDVDITVE